MSIIVDEYQFYDPAAGVQTVYPIVTVNGVATSSPVAGATHVARLDQSTTACTVRICLSGGLYPAGIFGLEGGWAGSGYLPPPSAGLTDLAGGTFWIYVPAAGGQPGCFEIELYQASVAGFRTDTDINAFFNASFAGLSEIGTVPFPNATGANQNTSVAGWTFGTLIPPPTSGSYAISGNYTLSLTLQAEPRFVLFQQGGGGASLPSSVVADPHAAPFTQTIEVTLAAIACDDCDPGVKPANASCGSLAACYEINGQINQINVSGGVVTSSTAAGTVSAPAYQTSGCTFQTSNTAVGALTISLDATANLWNLSNGVFTATKSTGIDPIGFYLDDSRINYDVGQTCSLADGSYSILRFNNVRPCTSAFEAICSALPTSYVVSGEAYRGNVSGGTVTYEEDLGPVSVVCTNSTSTESFYGTCVWQSAYGQIAPGWVGSLFIGPPTSTPVTGALQGGEIAQATSSPSAWPISTNVQGGAVNLTTGGTDPTGAASDPNFSVLPDGQYLYLRNAGVS